MLGTNWLRGITLGLFLLGLACSAVRQTPQPGPELQPLAYEVQTATPTVPAVLSLLDESLTTPTPYALSIIPNTPQASVSTEAQATVETAAQTSVKTKDAAAEVEPVVEPSVEAESTLTVESDVNQAKPTLAPPPPTPTVPLAKPLQGGEWDFEVDFATWINPHGDACAGSGLAQGWMAFTTRDEYGSSCFNETTWANNVFIGGSAQEITFAYVGNQAGIFKTAPTIPGHYYTVEAHMRREASPAKLEVSLGIDTSGNTNWQAETVQWFPWDEDFEDQWSTTEETVLAGAESITIFIKGSHPYPEPGGALRIDSLRVLDLGPEGKSE